MIDVNQYIIVERLKTNSTFTNSKLIQNMKTKETFLAKTICINDEEGINKKIFIWKIVTMLHIYHPSLYPIFGYSLKDFDNGDNVTIIMKPPKNDSLLKLLQDIKNNTSDLSISNTTLQKILIGIACGMMFLHRHHIVHGNLKPENILLDENYKPLITDFYLSKNCSLQDTSSIYTAPETIKSEQLNGKSDVYSFSMIMFEIVTATTPFPAFQNKQMTSFDFHNKVVSEKYRPEFTVPVKDSLKKLIEKCWSDNPSDRPTFEEIFYRLAFSQEGSVYDSNWNEGEFKYYLEDADISEILSYAFEINDDSNSTEKLKGKSEKIENKLNEYEMNIKKLPEKENEEIKTEAQQSTSEQKELAKDDEELKTASVKSFNEEEKQAKDNEELQTPPVESFNEQRKPTKDNEEIAAPQINEQEELEKDNEEMQTLPIKSLNEQEEPTKDNDEITTQQVKSLNEQEKTTKNTQKLQAPVKSFKEQEKHAEDEESKAPQVKPSNEQEKRRRGSDKLKIASAKSFVSKDKLKKGKDDFKISSSKSFNPNNKKKFASTSIRHQQHKPFHNLNTSTSNDGELYLLKSLSKIEGIDSDDIDFKPLENQVRDIEMVENENKSFDEIIVGPNSSQILQAISDIGFNKPSNAQVHAIPLLSEQKADLLIQSQNGSGKTLAFIVAMLLRVDPEIHNLQAICMLNSQELAQQTFDLFNKMNVHTKFKGEICIDNMRQPPSDTQLLFGMPASFLYYIKEKAINVSSLNFAVFDEADSIFEKDSENYSPAIKLIKSLKIDTRCSFFTSTFTNSVAETLRPFRGNITTIRLKNMNEKVQHWYTKVDNEEEALDCILELVCMVKKGQIIIFTRSKEKVKILLEFLCSNDISCKQFSSELAPQKRYNNIEAFRNDDFKVLIATDVLPRGLEIPNLNLVINYQTPIIWKSVFNFNSRSSSQQKKQYPDRATYFNRAERVGRLGHPGLCFTVVIDPGDELALKGFLSTKQLNIPLNFIEKNQFDTLPIDDIIY